MIKKLRKKFVLINMALVTLVLVIAFASLLVINIRKYREDSQRSLERAMDDGKGSMPADKLGNKNNDAGPDNMNPVFVVLVSEDGTIAEIDASRINVDETFAAQAVAAALDSNESFGMLSSLKLRFLKSEGTDSFRIAFEDCSHEINAVSNLVFVEIMIFIGGMAAFLLISLFLSKWALEPVERAWRQQKQFIADASHELKTPLTVILANLGILSSHPGDTIHKQYRWLDNTQTEAARMKQLLDNLLFLAKSDAAEVPQEHREFDLSNALLSCILPFEPLAYEQEVTLQEQVTPGIMMNGDEHQIKQLIAILLDNGCKYTKAGGTVTVTLKRKDDRPERAVLKVINSGEPIPKADQEHIFERFYRSDKSRVRIKGGYGLGLSIAKTITETHKGKIRVDSSLTDGTCFTVVFPVL